MRAGYGAVFALAEFRAIFTAHVLSVLGSVFAEVSLAVLVFRQTGSALLTALIFALGFAPYALSGILRSCLADGQPPRRLLGPSRTPRGRAPLGSVCSWPRCPREPW